MNRGNHSSLGPVDAFLSDLWLDNPNPNTMDDFGDDDINALVNDEDELRAEMEAENENQVELEPDDESEGDDTLRLSENLAKQWPDRQKGELGIPSHRVSSYSEKQKTAAAPRPFGTSSVVNELERKTLKGADKGDVLSRLQRNSRTLSNSGVSSHTSGGLQWMETVKDIVDSRVRDPKRVLIRPPFDCESVYWTVPPYQTRVYFRLMRVDEEEADEFVAEKEASDKGLLSASNLKYDAVFREVEKRIAATFIKSSDADVNDELKRIESGVPCSTSAEDYRLWVDSHAPSTFTHLLSDERINREVLRAVKAWDPFVFGKDYHKKKSPINNTGKYGLHCLCRLYLISMLKQNHLRKPPLPLHYYLHPLNVTDQNPTEIEKILFLSGCNALTSRHLILYG